MSKPNIEKIYKELDRLEEKDILPTFTSIRDFLHKKLTAIHKEAEEKASERQSKIDELK